MKLLAIVAVAAGIVYLVARKTGVMNSPEAERLATRAKDMARHAGETAMEARQSAMESTADKVEDLAGRAADGIRSDS